jgi:hypothetical protein
VRRSRSRIGCSRGSRGTGTAGESMTRVNSAIVEDSEHPDIVSYKQSLRKHSMQLSIVELQTE